MLLAYAFVATAHVRSSVAETREAPEDGPDGPVGPPLALTRLVGSAALVLHIGLFVHEAVFTSMLPGFAESLSAVSFGIMVAWWALVKDRTSSLGAVLAPVGVIFYWSSFLAPSQQISALGLAGASWWLPVHLGLVFAAVTGFFVEFFVGAVQVWVHRRLKKKRFMGLHRFPSLETLDRIQFRALVFGLVCLAAGITVGALGASTVLHHQAWIVDPKVAVTLVIWVWYAASLAVRLFVGWHGRWSMTLSVMGFLGLVFSVVGLDFITQGFHAYGG